jgi:probable HAF family extracellular repeat protein
VQAARLNQAVIGSHTCALSAVVVQEVIGGNIAAPATIEIRSAAPPPVSAIFPLTTTDLGDLGGELNNTPATVNDRGEVAGASDLAGDTTYHTFLWIKGTGMQDLDTVSTDLSS